MMLSLFRHHSMHSREILCAQEQPTGLITSVPDRPRKPPQCRVLELQHKLDRPQGARKMAGCNTLCGFNALFSGDILARDYYSRCKAKQTQFPRSFFEFSLFTYCSWFSLERELKYMLVLGQGDAKRKRKK